MEERLILGSTFTYPEWNVWEKISPIPMPTALVWLKEVCPSVGLNPLKETAFQVASNHGPNMWSNKKAVVVSIKNHIIALYKEDANVWIIKIR